MFYNTNPKALWGRLHYLINRQKFPLGLVLCNCRQARTTRKVRIPPPGSSRCKDGGRGAAMMGVDIRGGVMLGINMRREVSTEGCLTVAGSMHRKIRSSGC